MRYEIELLAHGGVKGKNSVEPFGGNVEDMGTFAERVPGDNELFSNVVEFEGRLFTHAYTVEERDRRRYCFREKVQGEPSDWAREQADA